MSVISYHKSISDSIRLLYGIRLSICVCSYECNLHFKHPCLFEPHKNDLQNFLWSPDFAVT